MRDCLLHFALLAGLASCSLESPRFQGVDAQSAEDAHDAIAPDDAAVDAGVMIDAAASVAVELVMGAAGDSIRAGLPTTVRWSAAGVTACTASSGAAVAGWDGPLPTLVGEREVTPTAGIHTLSVTCDDGGAGVSGMVTLAAMRLDVGTETLMRPASTTLDWDAPGATDCAGIAVPMGSGGLGNGGAYEPSGHFMYFGPVGTSDQGFVCRDATGARLYRAVVHMVVQG